MKLGFTGSREGGSWVQLQGFTRAVAALRPTFFVHGDCIGWDAIAAQHVAQAYPDCRIAKYPSNSPGMTAKAPGIDAALPQAPLTRDWDIVKTTWVLLACPKTAKEEQNSGTWYTVRAARKHEKPVILVKPDGEIALERIVMLRVGTLTIDLPKLVRGLK